MPGRPAGRRGTVRGWLQRAPAARARCRPVRWRFGSTQVAEFPSSFTSGTCSPPARPQRPVPALPGERPLLLESAELQYPAGRDTLRMQQTIKSFNASMHTLPRRASGHVHGVRQSVNEAELLRMSRKVLTMGNFKSARSTIFNLLVERSRTHLARTRFRTGIVDLFCVDLRNLRSN